MLDTWKDWEEDNPRELEPKEKEKEAKEKEKKERKGPGLVPITKKPTGASRVQAIISDRVANRKTMRALDQVVESERRDLLENQWRPS